MRIRLQKYLAQAGFGSRRACEELIREGRVTVDGMTATLGTTVDPCSQIVACDGRPVRAEPKEYWLLNKPAGVLSTVSDRRGRRTVVDYVPSSARVFPVGRLDMDSTGLLLLTNDGDLAAALLHPRYHVPKEYLVTVEGDLGLAAIDLLRAGVDLEEGRTAPAQVEVISRRHSRRGERSTILRIILHEGRKRQIRRMVELVGGRVTRLHRTRFANLSDADLAIGACRPLTQAEVAELWRQTRKQR